MISIEFDSFKVHLRAATDDVITTVTFGAPPVGKKAFKEIYDKMISFSFHFKNPSGDIVSGYRASTYSQNSTHIIYQIKFST